MATLIDPTIGSFSPAVKHDDDGVSGWIGRVVNIWRQKPVINEKIIGESIFLMKVTLAVGGGVPGCHGLISIGLHPGRTLPIAESLAFLEVVIPGGRFCQAQVEGAIRHALTIYIRSVYLRKCA